MKRTLKILGIAVAVLVGLLVLAVVGVALFVDLDGMVNEQVAKHRPEVEQKLGRKVEVGTLSTRLFPSLQVELESVTVAGQNEQDAPLVSVGPVRLKVALWDAIVSRGERITVNEVVVSGLKVNLVRAADGRLSYQDILDRQAQEEPAPEPKPAEAKSGLGGFALEELRIEDAELRFVDHATATGAPAESTIKKLNVRAADLRAGANLVVTIDAALFAEATNFQLKAVAGPLPKDGAEGEPEPSLQSFSLKMDAVDLSRAGPYLPSSSGARIDSALASAQWEVGAMSEAAPFPVKGFFELEQVQLEGGKKFDLRMDTELTADLAGPGVQLAKFELAVGEVKLVASGALETLATAPKFRDFKVSSTTLSPSALLSYFPAASADLPPGTRFSGAAKLEVSAQGDAQKQTLAAKLDLSPLDVLYPGTLLKPAGVPLALEVKGDFTRADATLERLAVVLDELALVVRGTVKNFDSPSFDLTASAAPFSLDRLVRLAPSVGEQLKAKGATASGKGELAGHLKGTKADLDAALRFSLEGMKLDVPGTRLEGDLKFQASAKGNPEKSLRAQLQFDADQAEIRVKKVMDKGMKTPLHLTMAVQRTPERLDVERFDLRLAELGMRVTGGLDYPKNVVDVKVDLDRLDLEKFARTVTAIPAHRVKNSHLAMKLALKGDPDRMETLELAMTGIDVRLGRSDLRGEAVLKNPSRPDLTTTLKSRLLDLDELFPDDDDEEEAGEAGKGESAPEPDDPELKEYRVLAKLEADKVIYEKTDLSKFRGTVRLEDGKLTLEEASFGAYGGTVSANGTQVEIWRGQMPFDAKVNARGIELGQALADHTRYGNALQGKTDLTLQLRGKGYETAELEQFLTGEIELAMKQGRIAKGNVADAVVGKLEGLEKIPGLSLQPVRSDNAIRDLAAKLVVKDGKLTLAQPVTFALDQSKATLGGAVGIAGKLFLDGTYYLPGSVLSTATGGRCQSKTEVPVPLSVAGTIDGPEFLPRPAEAARAVVQACVASAATSAAAAKAKEALGVDVPTSRAEAEKAAQEALQKQKAEAETRLRQEAERQAQEQRRKAEEAAKKKAADALKKGFGF